MTIVIGTDAYGSVANSDTYWSRRSNSEWTTASVSSKESNLIKAADWLDRTFTFIGTPSTSSQRLSWPRSYAYDILGAPIEGIPPVLEEANYIMADLFRQGTYDFEGIITQDSFIKKERVEGAIEIEYDTARLSQSGTVPSHVFNMLRTITDNGRIVRS